MKVKQLIEQLQKLPEDTEVWVSKDEEGNGFNPLEDIDYASVWFHSNWEFDYVAEEDKDEYPEDEFKHIVVLWP